MIILTWNRDREHVWPENEYNEARKKCLNGGVYNGSWSVSRHKTIPINSEVFFFVQGQKHTRGIVATGITTSIPWLDKHWDDPKKKTNYVRIKVTEMLELDDAIPVNLLEDRVPGVPWRVIRASGFTVRGKSQASLRDVWSNFSGREELPDPGELPPADYVEGGIRTIKVNRYERDPRARKACLAHHGNLCFVCRTNLVDVYGPDLGATAIHVHHIKPMSSQRKKSYKVNPTKDLIPLCPNCHNVIHKTTPVLTPQALRKIYLARN